MLQQCIGQLQHFCIRDYLSSYSTGRDITTLIHPEGLHEPDPSLAKASTLTGLQTPTAPDRCKRAGRQCPSCLDKPLNSVQLDTSNMQRR